MSIIFVQIFKVNKRETIMKTCLVLLATYNGSEFIKEQLDSILFQEGVKVHIVVSDDMSDDNTLDIIKNYQSNKITILPNIGKFGSASQNFFRLIRDSNVEKFDFIAFADQDDIWNTDKLKNAIDCIENKNIDAYSSNVMAFWRNGKELLIDKSGQNKKYDYLFSSAGPGCTYVFTKRLYQDFKEQLFIKKSITKSIKLHDWLIYAFARSHNYEWFVDSNVGMKYRQHGSNEFGANSGVRAIYDRWKKAHLGWYRGQILLTAEFCDVNNKIITNLKNNSYLDRLFLLKYIFQCRKKITESIFLGFVFLVPGFR